MGEALDRVADAIDVETFLLGQTEEECLRLARALMEELGLPECDVISLQYRGLGARVRLRAYVHRPGGTYGWLKRVVPHAG
ncbi:MAG: hypothetical protein AB1503_10500 [Bacillota bacterium]|nr:hypothetical protein [Bacillota bacterium]